MEEQELKSGLYDTFEIFERVCLSINFRYGLIHRLLNCAVWITEVICHGMRCGGR